MSRAVAGLDADFGVWGPQASGLPATRTQAKDWVDALARSRAWGGAAYVPILSRRLPAALRDDFAAVYAFCRRTKGLADPARSPDQALERLAWWRSELRRGFAGDPHHPVFVALAPTITRRGLEQADFEDVINAFEQDHKVTRYADLPQLLNDCARRADPLGRIVLRLYGAYDDAHAAWASATCTALQLTGLWQNVRRDALERGRVCLPADVAARHGLDLDVMVRQMKLEAALTCGVGCPRPRVGGGGGGAAELLPAYRAVVRELVSDTRERFVIGRALWPAVAPRLRGSLRAFTLGGEAVLEEIERRGFDTYTTRPRVGWVGKAWVRVRAGLVRG